MNMSNASTERQDASRPVGAAAVFDPCVFCGGYAALIFRLKDRLLTECGEDWRGKAGVRSVCSVCASEISKALRNSR